jgi:hypothetical protein
MRRSLSHRRDAGWRAAINDDVGRAFLRSGESWSKNGQAKQDVEQLAHQIRISFRHFRISQAAFNLVEELLWNGHGAMLPGARAVWRSFLELCRLARKSVLP